MKLIRISSLLILAAALFGACSDDLAGGNSASDAEKSLTIYIPKSPEASTRAVGAWDPQEVTFSSLRLIAYPVKNGEVLAPLTRNLLDTDETTQTAFNAPEGYDAFSLDLPNGEYRMYIVANSSNVDGTETEDKLLLKNAVVPSDLSKGLPMSCAHSSLKVSTNGSGLADIGGSLIPINSTASKKTVIQADLKFAVAKFRITLLNDIDPKSLVADYVVKGHKADSRLLPDDSYASAAGADLTPQAKYYAMPVKTSDGLIKTNVDNLQPELGEPASSQEWAWQSVFYLPEQLVQTDAAYAHADLKVGTRDLSLKLGELSGSARKIERSRFYDYVGTPDGRFELKVSNWEPVTIVGALQGPSYLHVSDTKVSIEAGQKTSIWYDANHPLLWKSEQFEGRNVYLFEFNRANNPDSVRVWLNPNINGEAYKRLRTHPELWDNFTLSSGNITKKIAVDPLVYAEFIEVNPEMTTIDIAEKKTSGDYSNFAPLRIYTNFSSIRIKKVGWLNDEESRNSLYLVRLNGETETRIADSGSEVISDIPDNGIVTLRIRYSGLNTSREIWQDDRDFEIVVEGTNADGQTVTVSSMVYIRAANDTYKIHFKAPGWSHPHIYVYQCLQLPSTHSRYPNQPVGADRQKAGYTAALEYSFTGKLAFKGWNVGSYNDPEAAGSMGANYFYYFNDASDGSWEPGSAANIAHYYIMDFCSTHRSLLGSYCSLCTGGGYAAAWPGIHMIKDPDAPAGENDWWFFELTGVATPGKALIMFTDCNAGSHEARKVNNLPVRYPDNYRDAYGNETGGADPGVPLFDYPAKEGWFVYAGRKSDGSMIRSSFTATPPYGESESRIYTYRIYWPYKNGASDKWKGLNVWKGTTVWGNKIYTNYPSEQSWTGFKYAKYNDQYVYLEFKVENTPLSGSLKYQRIYDTNSYDSTQPTVQLSDFTTDSDGIYSYTVVSVNNGHSGKP